MVTTRSQDANKATASAAQHESAKSTATSKPHSARHSSKASHGRKQQIVTKGKPQRKIGQSKPNQKALQENEANREWTNQYYQGKSVMDFHGLGCGSCPLSSPQITFMSPFADEGSLEIMTGADGPGTGGLRLVKGSSNDPGRGLPDILMVPLQNVEQVIVVPGTSETSKGVWQVAIVPTAATGTSAMVNKRPQMIQFEWPDRDVDELLKGNAAENMSKKDNATYLSILRAVLDEQLALYDKKVIVYTEETPPTAQSPRLSCSAKLSKIQGTLVKKNLGGSLYFLPTGMLWLSWINLYLPFSSLPPNMMIIYIRDLASGTPEDKQPVVAMALMLDVPDSLADADDDESTRLMYFGKIKDYATMGKAIENYLVEHGFQVMKLQEIYYNYEEGQMMTGFMDYEER